MIDQGLVGGSTPIFLRLKLYVSPLSLHSDQLFKDRFVLGNLEQWLRLLQLLDRSNASVLFQSGYGLTLLELCIMILFTGGNVRV